MSFLSNYFDKKINQWGLNDSANLPYLNLIKQNFKFTSLSLFGFSLLAFILIWLKLTPFLVILFFATFVLQLQYLFTNTYAFAKLKFNEKDKLLKHWFVYMVVMSILTAVNMAHIPFISLLSFFFLPYLFGMPFAMIRSHYEQHLLLANKKECLFVEEQRKDVFEFLIKKENQDLYDTFSKTHQDLMILKDNINQDGMTYDATLSTQIIQLEAFMKSEISNIYDEYQHNNIIKNIMSNLNNEINQAKEHIEKEFKNIQEKIINKQTQKIKSQIQNIQSHQHNPIMIEYQEPNNTFNFFNKERHKEHQTNQY